MGSHDMDSFFGYGCDDGSSWVREVAMSDDGGSAYSSSELVELGESEKMTPMDDHGVCT